MCVKLLFTKPVKKSINGENISILNGAINLFILKLCLFLFSVYEISIKQLYTIRTYNPFSFQKFQHDGTLKRSFLDF